MPPKIYSQIRIFVIIISTILVLGSFGYMTLAGVSFMDALYMTVITITSVGYKEALRIDSAPLKIWTILLCFSGVFVLAAGFSVVATSVFEGYLNKALRRRKMDRSIEKLKDHYIICGAGRVGTRVIREFKKSGREFVVIEKEQEVIDTLQVEIGEFNYFLGDSTHDASLIKSGIEHAIGLISVLPSDADNLYVVVTARSLNPHIKIATRANDSYSQPKLERAGADYVILPELVGGMRLASVMIRPVLVDFLDLVMFDKDDRALHMEQMVLNERSPFIGKTLQDARIPQETGLIIISMKDGETGKYTFNPSRDIMLKSGDTLIALGDMTQIARLRSYLNC